MFELSKVVGFLIEPRSVLFALLILGTLLLWTPARFAGRRLVTFCVAVAILFNVVPIGPYLLEKLEYRFPPPSAPFEKVDGIVVLGGDFNAPLAEAVGALIEPSPRLITLSVLARRYPQARIVFSGGSGSMIRPDLKEANLAKPMLAELGVDPARVLFEGESRNTVENATYTYRAAAPKPDETWLIVTSASHMPRAMGTFRRAGWTITPYPVDFSTHPQLKSGIGSYFDAGLNSVTIVLREAVGLIVYYALGRSDALFPGP